MKLKTLKDLDFSKCVVAGIIMGKDIDDILRQEAIREIKFPNIEELFLSGRVDLLPEIKKIIGEGIKSYIKWKNNITEEDLK